jgi:WD40 repeat protein
MHILILFQLTVLNSLFFLHSSPTHLEGGEILRSSGGEKLSCITTTHCSTYFIGGSVSGAIYIWLVSLICSKKTHHYQISTGALMNSWEGHYKKVTSGSFISSRQLLTSTTVCVTDDDSFLLSGGEDSIINVWSLAAVLDASR